MAASLVSSIISFLLFIILSLFVIVDGNVFAAQMEHRNLEETMTMRRNLEGNGEGSSKIHFGGSRSKTAGGKTANVPAQNQPNQATALIKGYVLPTGRIAANVPQTQPNQAKPQVKNYVYPNPPGGK